MKTKSLFLGVLAIASLASCSDDKVTGISPSANGEEITYSVRSGKMTRANLYDSNIKPESFYVWAVIEGGNAYIKGDKITTKDGGTTYADEGGTHYWPTDDSSLDFYATNYADANLDLTSDVLSFDYTVAAAVADQEDLLYAVVPEQSSGTVNLNFRHALSQIVFKAVNEDGNLYVEIGGVGIYNVADEGTFTFPTEETTPHQELNEAYEEDGRGDWEITGNYEASYTIDDLEKTLEGKTSADLASDETALLLLPQEIELLADANHTTTGVAYLTLDCAVYNIAGEDYDADTDKQLLGEEGETTKVYFPIAIDWDAGKKYTYTFTFGGSGTNGSDNPSGEDEDGNENVLVPITYSVTVDEFVETDAIEEDAYTEYTGDDTEDED